MKSRHYLYFLWIFLLLAVGVRTWQLAEALDESGFYLPEYLTFCNAAGYAALGVAVLLLIVGRYGLRQDSSCVPPCKSLPLGAASLILACSCVPQAVIDYSLSVTMTDRCLALLPCVLLAASFTVMGSYQFRGSTVPFGVTVLPVLSELLRLIVSYSQFNGITRLSENVIYILFLCSFLSFLLAHCRVYSGVAGKRGLSLAYGTGACTAVFGLCASVPHWVMGQNRYALSIVGFGAAVYAIAFLTVMAYQKPAAQEKTQGDGVLWESAAGMPSAAPVPQEQADKDRPEA